MNLARPCDGWPTFCCGLRHLGAAGGAEILVVNLLRRTV
jgi:hypothetical protein